MRGLDFATGMCYHDVMKKKSPPIPLPPNDNIVPPTQEGVVEKYQNFVHFLASRYSHAEGMEPDDLFQEGVIGLLRAAELYKYDKNANFMTYAGYWIKQKMLRAMAVNFNILRWPCHCAGRLIRKSKEKDASGLKFGERRAKIVPTEVLDVPVDNEEERQVQEQSSLLSEYVSKLDDRSRLVVERRFGLGGNDEHTLEQVGDMLSLTRERVRQIEALALEKLKLLMVQDTPVDEVAEIMCCNSRRKFTARLADIIDLSIKTKASEAIGASYSKTMVALSSARMQAEAMRSSGVCDAGIKGRLGLDDRQLAWLFSRPIRRRAKRKKAQRTPRGASLMRDLDFLGSMIKVAKPIGVDAAADHFGLSPSTIRCMMSFARQAVRTGKGIELTEDEKSWLMTDNRGRKPRTTTTTV